MESAKSLEAIARCPHRDEIIATTLFLVPPSLLWIYHFLFFNTSVLESNLLSQSLHLPATTSYVLALKVLALKQENEKQKVDATNWSKVHSQNLDSSKKKESLNFDNCDIGEKKAQYH